MLQEADMDITSLAHNTRRTQGDEYLAVKFFHESVKDNTKSEQEGRPIYTDVEYIEIMQPGNKDNIVVRPATAMDKARFSLHYSKWKARTSENQEHIVGTPLAEWAGVTRSQANELSFFNVKTVEQLAHMADSNTNNMMGLGGLKEKAKKYLETSMDQATADRLARLDNENREMKAQLRRLLDAQDATQKSVELAQPQADYGEVRSLSDHEEVDEPVKRKRRTKAEMADATAV